MTIRPRLENAACRGHEELFLKPARGSRITDMRAICGSCWDRPDCFTWALEHEEGGFWAGHTAKERDALRTEYNITFLEIRTDYRRSPTATTQGSPT